MNSNLQDDPDEPKGDPPRTERGPARRRGFAYRVISWVVASLMVLAFWLAIRPQTWEALFPDYRRARAKRTQQIPPPPTLAEPGLAPAPRGPKVAPVPSHTGPSIAPSMAAARPAEGIGTGVLWGRVLDEQGRPVVGYTVGDQKEGEGASYEFARRTVTDATGAWRLEGCPAGRHSVRLFDRTETLFEAEAPRRARSVSFALATGESRQVELGVSPDDVMWSGRVRTRDGGVLGGCWVTIRSPFMSFERLLREDATFRWKLPPGRYAVTVAQGLQEFDVDLPGAPGSGTGRSPTEAYVGAGRDLDADIVVVAGRVSGKVRAPACSGGGAVVQFSGGSKPLSPEDAMQGRLPSGHAVASDGSFGPVFLPPGRYRLSLMCWGDANDPHLVSGGLRTASGEAAEIEIVEGGEVTGLEVQEE